MKSMQSLSSKRKRLINYSLLPSIIALAGPTMLEQLMQTAVQYVDTAMVGSLGTSATAAVGATTTVNWLVGSTLHAVGVGFLAYISQAMGAGRRADAKRAGAQAVLAVLLLGSVFTALTLSLSGVIPVMMQVDPAIRGLTSTYFFIIYAPMLFRTATIIFGTVLRAAGDTKTPMKVGVLVNVLNVALNFFLIYPTRRVCLLGGEITIIGAGMGVIGAAVATAVALAVGGIVITAVYLVHPTVSPVGESLKPDMSVLRPCLKVALPNAAQRFGTSFGYVVFASMVNSLGEIATAAHTIANTVESAFYIPGYGMQTASATLSGNARGAGDEQRMREQSRTIIVLEAAMMIVSGGLLFAFAPAMVGMFSSDPEVIRLGSLVLRMVALSEPFYGVSIVIEGMMQGLGRTGYPFAVNITGMWAIRILGTLICIGGLGLGLASAWGCMIMHNLLLFAMFFTYYIRGKLKVKSAPKSAENDNCCLQN